MIASSLLATGPRRVHVRPGPALISEGLPGAEAVFDPVSGETHFLSELPALLLRHIGAQAMGFQELIENMAGPLGLEPDHEAQVMAALVYLEGAELVESQPLSAD